MALIESKKIRWNVITYFVDFFHLARSRTLVYGFALASLGTFLISSSSHTIDFLVLIRLVISVYFVALATYLYNDLTDSEIDKENNRNNSSHSSTLRYKHIKYSVIGSFVTSILLAFSINVLTGIASISCLALAMAYSHPSIQLKNVFIVKTVVTSAGGFIAAFMGALALQQVSYLGISSSVILFFMYFINGPLGDVSDIPGDKKGGRRTIPIVLGMKNTFMIIHASLFSIFAIIVIDYLFFGLGMLGMVISLLICLVLILQIRKLSQNITLKQISKTRTIVRLSIFAIQLSLFIGIVSHQFLSL